MVLYLKVREAFFGDLFFEASLMHAFVVKKCLKANVMQVYRDIPCNSYDRVSFLDDY